MYVCFTSLHNQKKDNNQFKNKKKQPELIENQTTWNSNNQGDKEKFIQSGRRGRDRQPRQRVHMVDCRGKAGLADQVLPHLHMDKLVRATGEQDRY